MAQVTVRINGFAYTLGCNDGEEAHLQAMAERVDTKINQIKAAAGQSGEGRLLAMAALLMADDIFELEGALQTTRAQAEASARSVASDGAVAPVALPDPKLGRRLGRLAKRAEEIAADLEHPQVQ